MGCRTTTFTWPGVVRTIVRCMIVITAVAMTVTGIDRAAVAVPDSESGAVESAARWAWPTVGRTVLEPWGDPADEYAPGHRGVDIAAMPGEDLVAPAKGVVSFAGQVAGRSVVVVDHGDGVRSTLDGVDPLVARDEVVARGQRVATVASPGHCGPDRGCVHLGARFDETYVDPMRFLSAMAWPVLLPESAWDDGLSPRRPSETSQARGWAER